MLRDKQIVIAHAMWSIERGKRHIKIKSIHVHPTSLTIIKCNRIVTANAENSPMT